MMIERRWHGDCSLYALGIISESQSIDSSTMCGSQLLVIRFTVINPDFFCLIAFNTVSKYWSWEKNYILGVAMIVDS